MAAHLQPIQENLWWVIPGKLAGVRKPTAEELSQLQAAGVGAIVLNGQFDSIAGLATGTPNITEENLRDLK